MVTVTCQLNLTLSVPVAEHVEAVAREAHQRPSGAGRLLLEERLALESAGWDLNNQELMNIYKIIAELDPKKYQRAKEWLRDLAEE